MNEKQRKTVLLVDDKLENIISISMLLKKIDVNIVKALSGSEALSLLPKFDIGVIILDVKMPFMSGFELTRAIRQSEVHSKIPIIFMSAYEEHELEEYKSVKQQNDDFATKPLKVDLFIEKVQQMLNLSPNKAKNI